MNTKPAILFSSIITILIFLNSIVISQLIEKPLDVQKVSRVIDGDTLILVDGRKIRLLNVNSPESNIPNSNLSYFYLRSLEGSNISLEYVSIDKYSRILARIYSSNDYINLDLVSLGLSSSFLVSESEVKDFARAEISAISSGTGIWQHSEHYGCISSNIDALKEIVTLTNHCSKNLVNLTIKDESRKSLIISLSPISQVSLMSDFGFSNSTTYFWNSSTNVWNNDRDTLYLFDENFKIVHYNKYGY